MSHTAPARTSVRSSLLRRGGLAAAFMVGLTGAAAAQSACGVPPSGLVRLWAGIGCQGAAEDISSGMTLIDFPAFSISNGTGRWIAVTDTADPADARHTLLIQNGCYYGDLSLFHWRDGQSWVGHIRAIEILPPGTDPRTYPASGQKVIGQCQ